MYQRRLHDAADVSVPAQAPIGAMRQEEYERGWVLAELRAEAGFRPRRDDDGYPPFRPHALADHAEYGGASSGRSVGGGGGVGGGFGGGVDRGNNGARFSGRPGRDFPLLATAGGYSPRYDVQDGYDARAEHDARVMLSRERGSFRGAAGPSAHVALGGHEWRGYRPRSVAYPEEPAYAARDEYAQRGPHDVRQLHDGRDLHDVRQMHDRQDLHGGQRGYESGDAPNMAQRSAFSMAPVKDWGQGRSGPLPPSAPAVPMESSYMHDLATSLYQAQFRYLPLNSPPSIVPQIYAL